MTLSYLHHVRQINFFFPERFRRLRAVTRVERAKQNSTGKEIKMKKGFMKLKLQICPVIAALAVMLAGATRASADAVIDWNAIAEQAPARAYFYAPITPI